MSEHAVYEKILLAYDGSRDGQSALAEGAELARLCGAEVVLLAVVDTTAAVGIAEGYGGVQSGDQGEQIKRVLDEGLKRLQERGLAATGNLAYGNPANEIAATARSTGADLVVIGHRRHGLWSLWLDLPVGTYLMKDLPCSLLVVPPGPDPSTA